MQEIQRIKVGGYNSNEIDNYIIWDVNYEKINSNFPKIYITEELRNYYFIEFQNEYSEQ